MKRYAKKTVFSIGLSFLCLLFLINFNQRSLLATEIDSVQISGPVSVNINNPLQIIYSNETGEKYAIAKRNENDPSYSKNLYKIKDDKIEIIYTFLFDIEELTFLNNMIFFRGGFLCKGFDPITGDTTDYIFPTLAHGTKGISSMGDSIILYTDNEWNQVYLINVHTLSEKIIPVQSGHLLGAICYDSYNNRIYIVDGDPGILAIYLNNHNTVTRIRTNYDPGNFGHRGLITDNWGNIFQTFKDTNGVYLVDRESKQLVQITDLPKEPGYLFYNKEEDYLMVPDLSNSSLYTIWLKRNISTSVPTNEMKQDGFFNTTVFPNPSKGFINISFELTQSMNGKIDIFSIDGKLIHSIPEQNWNQGKNIVLLNTKKLKAGTYYLQISGSDSKSLQKVVVLE